MRQSLMLGAAMISIGLAGLPSQAMADDSGSGLETVIVTGTRVQGMTAADSAAPVMVLGVDALTHTGQGNLLSALAQQVPSFNAQAFGGDLAEYTLSARLRGISPNDTLVLVNGKRRHTTGDFHVLGGPYQGSDTADLSLIPLAAIDHVEVLQDGAAAQYGSDAIAGVVNIILKSDTSAGFAQGTVGEYYKGDGQTYDITINKGLPLFGHGFINLTYDKKYHGFSQRGFGDNRIMSADGTLKTGLSFDPTKVDGYPNVNKILGDALYSMSTYSYNAGYDISDNVHLYSFGTFGTRSAKGYENVRLPPLNVAQSKYYPDGFSPFEAIRETDYQLAFGIKGMLDSWRWDLSTTYGEDRDEIYTLHSGNNSLYKDTGFTPTKFYDGAFIAGEWTSNLDISREIEIGLASPLTLAFGGEVREDSYQINHGDPASIYKEGGQSYPGYLPSDAGFHSRKNYAGYFDVAVFPIEALQVDVAGRFEHYTDFGNAKIGKITARYDFSPAFAIRGTASTGFRAPTLAEEYYSATNVSPTAAFVQLPPNSSAARLLGIPTLQPEASTNYSLGIVAHPLDGLSMTLDAYSISLRNRIVGTGALYGTAGGATISPAVTAAIVAHGNVLDPTVVFTGAEMFVNGISTLTQGIDLTANYASDFGDAGSVTWTLAANFNETSISHEAATPTPLVPQNLFSKTAISILKNASPKEKVSLGAYWTLGAWSANLQETIFGPSSEINSPNGTDYYLNKIPTTAITDLEVSYNITTALKLTLGGNNIFDENPPSYLLTPTGGISTGGHVFDAPMTFSPFGINGGYYYLKVGYTF